MTDLNSSLRSLAEALRVPHTGADGEKYAIIINGSRDDPAARADFGRRSAEALGRASGDNAAFMNSYDSLAARGPRVANVVGKILGLAEQVSKNKALKALVTTAYNSNTRVVAEARPASESLSSKHIQESDSTAVATSVRMHRTGSVTVSTGGNDVDTTSILNDISSATHTTRLNLDVGGDERNLVSSVMSPSTWGKLQGISVSSASANNAGNAKAGARSGAPVARSKSTLSRSESPSSLMAELNKVNLGRAPQNLQSKTNTNRRNLASTATHGNTRAVVPHTLTENPTFGTYEAQRGANIVDDDEQSPVSLRFGQTVVLRSAGTVGGGFLNSQGRGSPMILAEGRPTELILVNGNFRDDVGTVRYGDIVSFQIRGADGGVMAASAKSGAACVGTALGGTEKWTLVSPEEAASVAGLGTASSYKSDKYSSLSTLKSSDPILLRANSLGGRYLDSRLELVERAPLASQSWYLVHAHTPYVPAWNHTRPYLCGHYMDRGFSGSSVAQLPDDSPAKVRWLEQRPSPLRSYPAALQENFLIEDLLSAMLGIGGRYLRASSSNDSLFALDQDLSRDADPSVCYLAARILPIAGHYVRVSTFVETRSQYQYGLSVHALCAAMRSLVSEHTILVAQLEHQFRLGQLSLQKLFFYVQPAQRTLGKYVLLSLRIASLCLPSLLTFTFTMHSMNKTFQPHLMTLYTRLGSAQEALC